MKKHPSILSPVRGYRTLGSLLSLGFALSAWCATPAGAATGTLVGLAADAQVNQLSGVNNVAGQTTAYLPVGAYYNTMQLDAVYVFQVPASILSDPSQWFSAATFRVTRGAASPSNYTPAFNADLYGIGSGTSSTVLASDFYEGSLDPDGSLIVDDFLVPSVPINTEVSASNSLLVSYLNGELAAARADGSGSLYVFFRINPNAYLSKGAYYNVGMSEAGGAVAPALDYTTDTIAGWQTVALGGGGYVTGLVTNPPGGDIYCRTDVGGAFHWDSATGSWSSITDTIVPVSTQYGRDLMSIASLAIDPANTNQLYVAAGRSVSAGTLRGIYSSSDKGATWVPIKTDITIVGQDAFRAVGERLAVDPNDSNILWYGSSQDGLLKGVKSGSGWSWTQIPASSVPFGQVASGDKAGVTFVVCDPNGASTITYAGVYDSVGATGGVYQTTDGGSTWSKLSGAAFGKPLQGRLAANGILYVTGSNNGVAKAPRGGSLALLSTLPTGIVYRGLAVDPSDADGDTVYVSQDASAWAKIWRSTDGGATWAMQQVNFNNLIRDRAEPDGTPSVTGYWFGATSALLVNPADPSELWASDFFGVYRTEDVQNLGTTNGCYWYTLQKEQEETVVEAIKNAPTGARLLTALADVTGYRYNTATNTRPTGSAGNDLRNPNHPVNGTSTSLDFCESNPDVWARGWVNATRTAGSGAVSSDGGATWLDFGKIAAHVVTSGPAAGTETWDLSTYLARQKAKGATSVTLALCSTNAISPKYSNSLVNFDSREATNPAVRPKLVVNGSTTLSPTADAYVAGAATGANYGTATNLAVSYKGGNAGDSRWTYLKFDLSSVGAVTSASLQLSRQSSAYTATYEVGVYACAATASWTETGIVWNNRPGPLAGPTDPVGDPRYYDGASLLHGGRVAVSSTNPDVMVWMPLIVGTAPRYSDDRGVTWTACAGAPVSQMANQFVPSVSIQPLASDRVNGKFYLATFGGASHTIYSSTDGGATFSVCGSVAAGTWNNYRAQIVAAPVADDVWVCDDGIENVTKGGLWHSTDGGATWGSRLTGLTAVSQVTFGKPKPNQTACKYTVFINGYRAGVRGIYRSDDYGATWVKLVDAPTNQDISVMAGDRQNYGPVFIGTNGRGAFVGQ
jgi:photosystem II stability/assembly factor-like uncharacterized protein